MIPRPAKQVRTRPATPAEERAAAIVRKRQANWADTPTRERPPPEFGNAADRANWYDSRQVQRRRWLMKFKQRHHPNRPRTKLPERLKAPMRALYIRQQKS